MGYERNRTGETSHPIIYRITVGRVFKNFLKKYGGIASHNAGDVLSQQPGAYIVAPVHRSMLDSLVVTLSALEGNGRQLHFMTKSEMWNIPGLGQFLSTIGGFAVDRTQALPMATLDHISSIVTNNAALGIFPEGERCKGDEVSRKQLKRSVAAIAMHHSLPIIPVGIAGTEESNRGPIHAVFGSPIHPDGAHTDINLYDPRSYVKVVRPLMDELHAAMNDVQQRATQL